MSEDINIYHKFLIQKNKLIQCVINPDPLYIKYYIKLNETHSICIFVISLPRNYELLSGTIKLTLLEKYAADQENRTKMLFLDR